ncbi:alpha/beta fold hydrolase [Streptomyces sp. NPDC001513]|uniref:alpha/beta fold hydrolase n=1 Tax=Streptomyces sp. NPDC001513 TaxID=3364580 RepID=UPI003682CEF5
MLVHGGFVDGSGWRGVYDHLTADGYRVAAVQNPTLSPAGDVAATHQVLDDLDGPAVLVGHSYGGVVITEAGNHPGVAALAYIAAFAPDKGESVGSLIADPAPGAPVPSTLPPCHPATHGRSPAPGPGPVRSLLRLRCPRTDGRVHGRLPGPLGRQTPSTGRSPHRPGRPSRRGTWSPPTTG